MNNNYKPKLFIVSAPSGAGKTSLIKNITQEISTCQASISHTTRSKRPGEIEGVDYFFVTLKAFKDMLKRQAFLEHALVFNNYYGTSKYNIETLLTQGVNIILEIDWQGAQQVRTLCPDSISIFILPPSRDILEQRLHSRGQDSEQTISHRMQEATAEISHYDKYDYLIINDQLAQATAQLKAIINSDYSQIPDKKSHAELLNKLLN